MLRHFGLTALALTVLFHALPADAGGEQASAGSTVAPSLKSQWEDAGVTVGADLTGYANQLVSGDGDDDVALEGRLDVFVDLSSDKLGWWHGGSIRTHSEIHFGDARGSFGGALLPANTGAFLPLGGKDRLVMSSLYLAQSVGERSALLVGKINVLDLLADDPVLGGWGTRRFQHIAFVAPPSGVVPPTIMGAVFVHASEPVSWTFMVMDPNDRTNDYWVDGLFDDGVNLSIAPTWSGTWADRPASLGLTLGYSSARGTNLEEVLLSPDLRTGDKKGSYNVALAATYRLVDSQVIEGKGLDTYLEIATADGNPNPIQGSITFGVAGHGMVAHRPDDSFGVGTFWFDFSNDLQSAVSPQVDFRDESGLEAWYSFRMASHFDLTAGMQWLSPANGNNGDAFVLGLRGRLFF